VAEPATTDKTVQAFLERFGHESARTVILKRQVVFYLAMFFLLFLLLSYDYLHFLHFTHVLCTFYILIVLHKTAMVLLAIVKRPEIRIDDETLNALDEATLPMYTILVPLYREVAVADKIIKSLRALDYPQDKMDVKLLLEADDEETLHACRTADLPKHWEIIVVPDCAPKTKPRACNHGLECAKGEYLVIYDAEDRPDPDQLKKAVAAFRNVPDNTVCLQAKLNYFNPSDNLLTKWFTIEYTTWFDLFLPGLHRMGAPIPLGGTSNHFKTTILRELGGWDPFNVTEDCDLGIRLYRRKYRTAILESTTWEEANSRMGNWIRQRSRWVKGYIQTHLVHMRHPFKILRELGPWGLINFYITVGGLSMMLLLNPIFWLVVGLYMKFRWQMLFEGDVLSYIFFGVTCALALGNIIFVGINVIACLRRRMPNLILYALISPLYWVLISIAAWKGFLQLLWAPHYWEKTLHGLSPEETPVVHDT